MEVGRQGRFTCLSSIAACFILSVSYVASLYIWSTRESRDHPSTIKRRFFSVFVMMCLSPPFVSFFITEDILQKNSMWELLGLRLEGLLPALVLPLVLTMILFLGPLSMQGLSGFWSLYTEPMYWVWNMRDLTFLRSTIVAPIAEEFAFRACMIPLLLQCYTPMTAVFIACLLFGVAHIHHIVNRVCYENFTFKQAMMVACVQMSYASVFGAYSAYLFIRTGHFAAPCIAHAFCNLMGFPDFAEVLSYQNPRRLIVGSLYIVGLACWGFLLIPMTNPSFYNNNLFWNTQL